MSLAEQVLEGNVRAAARLMRDIDDGRPQAIEELKQLYPRTGNAFIIGITGPPGARKIDAGRSTDRLVSIAGEKSRRSRDRSYQPLYRRCDPG